MKNIDPKTVRDQWLRHVAACGKCKRYEPSVVATLALTCLNGAALIKDVLELEAKPVLAKYRKSQREVWRAVMNITPEAGPTSKKKAQAAMRFK